LTAKERLIRYRREWARVAKGTKNGRYVNMREGWEGETIVNNLLLIRKARFEQGQAELWLETIIRSLDPRRP
jgi:hypothetical protein